MRTRSSHRHRLPQPPRARHSVLLAAALVFAGIATPAAAQPPAPPASSQSQPLPEEASIPTDRIVEVRIEGNHATEVAKLPKLLTRAGQIFDPRAVETDVRTLHRTRKFVDVQPKYVRAEEGVVVIFQVVERPMVRYVKIVGNQWVTTRTLRKRGEIEVGDSMDPYVVEEARRRIESYYHEKGFDAARVTTVEGNKPQDQGAVFLVDEGRRRKALWTSFVGNSIASDARLLTQIKSKPGIFWLLGGDIDREAIDADVEMLTAYYRSLGFFQAKVSREVQVVHEGLRDWTYLTFVINEGPRYVVRNVSFIGNSKFKTEFLERDLKLKSGEHFNQSRMDADLNLIRDVYGGRGFVFADIQADPRFLEEPGQLDLVYNIEEGQRYRVGKINVRIKGDHPHTRHSTILNRLSLRPGDILDIRKLRDDERRLKASMLFAADAAKGEGPRIVFSKAEEAEPIAQNPERPGFRGQSPDDEEGTLDLVLEVDWNEEAATRDAEGRADGADPATGPDDHPAAVGEEPAAAPNRTASERPVWRGQSPQPAPAAAPQAQAWGGAPLAPTGPEALDYSRFAAPPGPAAQPFVPMQQAGQEAPYQMVPQQPGAVPVYTVQQPVAPGAGTVAQAQFDPNQPPGFGGGGLGPGFAQPMPLPGAGGMPPAVAPGGVPAFGQPLQVFPGTEPYVIVDVDAEETQTGRLMIGAGVNSNAGLVGNIVVDEQNFDILRLPRSWDDIRNGVAFRGAGQRFRLEAAPGTQLQRYMATFQEPYLFDTRIGLSLSASYYTRYFFDWAEARTGGRVGFGYQFAFAPDLSVNAGFRGESVDVFDARVLAPDIVNMLGTNGVYGFSGGIIHDTRDSPFLPTQGHLATFEFEQVIGTYVYPRGVFEARQYFLMNERPDGSGRHVLSVGSVLGMSGPDTPAYDNFFAGGYNTIRGFTFRGASPRQAGPNGALAVVGGPFQWLNTIEYMFPITADDTLRGVVFTDAGTVESNVSINNFRVAPGVGLRITLPAMGPAPIALDFAFPVAYAPFDSQQLFSFFVGFAR